MLWRRLYLIPALLAGTLVPARAASISCTLQTGNPTANGPITAQGCDQALASPTASLNWGSVIGASSGPENGTAGLTGIVGGDTVTVTSEAMNSSNDTPVMVNNAPVAYDNLQGAYNAGDVWSSVYNAWEPAFVVAPGTTTFAGYFNSVTNSGTPTPPYGDNLLGILAPGGPSPGDAEVNLAFAQTLSFVEFQVTAESDPNFVATLVAYDAFGNILGTYTVNDTGTGGTCATLDQPNPQVCSPAAPFVQFYDPQDNIASVELTINDTTGAYIDSLETASSSASSVPEPSSFVMFGIAALALVWAAKRGKFIQLPRLTDAPRD
jgi:hypothetical protein